MRSEPLLNELMRLLKIYQNHENEDSFSGKHCQSSLFGKTKPHRTPAEGISFHNLEEIDALKKNERFKMNLRNVLGIKHSDDWIFNLNIGNVMHLSPMNLDELHTKLELTHELNRDAMLEKIVLITVAYFCVGTELRFLSSKSSSSESSRRESELAHAKSLRTACVFLPSECPLVTHIITSYKKHHLRHSTSPPR